MFSVLGKCTGVSCFQSSLTSCSLRDRCPSTQVVPLDNVGKCRKILPPELPEAYDPAKARANAPGTKVCVLSAALPMCPDIGGWWRGLHTRYCDRYMQVHRNCYMQCMLMASAPR